MWNNLWICIYYNKFIFSSTIISKSQRCLYKKLFYLKQNYFFLSNQQFPNILISGAHNRLELFYAQGDVKLYWQLREPLINWLTRTLDQQMKRWVMFYISQIIYIYIYISIRFLCHLPNPKYLLNMILLLFLIDKHFLQDHKVNNFQKNIRIKCPHMQWRILRLLREYSIFVFY